MTREIASFRFETKQFSTKYFTFIAFVSVASSRESRRRHGTNLPREQSNKFAIVRASSWFPISFPLLSFFLLCMHNIAAAAAAACPKDAAACVVINFIFLDAFSRLFLACPVKSLAIGAQQRSRFNDISLNEIYLPSPSRR